MSENPLAQYFRSPAIHLPLPSKGVGYPEGFLDMPPTGEVPVLPMTAVDEITYKTPDALFNGSAIVSVIQSCIPAIKDAWQMPVTDLTAVLTAIRIASFGHNLDLDTTCPKCGNEASYHLDLRNILDAITVADYDTPLTVGDLSIKFKPMVYKDLNDNNQLQFEEQKLQQIILTPNELSEEEHIRLLSESFKKVSAYTLKTLAKNIESVTTPDTVVTEEEFLIEFLREIDKQLYDRIKHEVISQKGQDGIKPLPVTCQAVHEVENDDGTTESVVCGHQYTIPFTLDMTSFFDQKS